MLACTAPAGANTTPEEHSEKQVADTITDLRAEDDLIMRSAQLAERVRMLPLFSAEHLTTAPVLMCLHQIDCLSQMGVC
jgi:hypothetical protein